MRILFVAMVNSVHTARWIEQLADQCWDIHVFPVTAELPHPELRGVTVQDVSLGMEGEARGDIRIARPGLVRKAAGRAARGLDSVSWLDRRAQRLVRVIREIRPDLVHSLELQHGGYLTLAARKLMGACFPPWIATNWGSDIQVFGRLPEHVGRIREVLAQCDFYSAECERDLRLARDFGFAGETLRVLPNAGGLRVSGLQGLRIDGPPSARRTIALKGYQNWAGRALVGLRALELVGPALEGYDVCVYSAAPAVRASAKRKERSIRASVRIVERSSHEAILALHGRSRASIGLSIGDGISTSMLEAMAMGSFPIQSNTACAGEWVQQAATAMLVDPDDPMDVAAALERVLHDDDLVDTAAKANAVTIASRASWSIIQPQVIELYREVVAT